jgi:phospholipid/cholesterol/gamma-HCH transport system permease protein
MSGVLSRADATLLACGRQAIGLLVYIGQLHTLTYLSFRSALVYQSRGIRHTVQVVCSQIYFTGWQAVPLVSAIAVAAGALVVLQASTQLTWLGGGQVLGDLLVLILVRELAPLITAMIVIARSGTAVASEIGNMRANREIDALQVFGIDPLSFIVFPRILGGIISLFSLSFIFCAVSIIGGYAVTSLLHQMPFVFFVQAIGQSLSPADFGVFLLKAVVSGFIIFSVACWQGLQVRQSSHEVPQSTTRAVVHSIGLVMAFHVVISVWTYFGRLVSLGVLS